MSKQETVDVTLRLPKQLIDFLKANEKHMEMTVDEYLIHAIVQAVGADLDTWETFVPRPRELVEKHGLMPILKEHGAACSYW